MSINWVLVNVSVAAWDWRSYANIVAIRGIVMVLMGEGSQCRSADMAMDREALRLVELRWMQGRIVVGLSPAGVLPKRLQCLWSLPKGSSTCFEISSAGVLTCTRFDFCRFARRDF